MYNGSPNAPGSFVLSSTAIFFTLFGIASKKYLLENPDIMAEIDAKVRAKIRGEEFVKETPNEEKTEE